MHGGELIAQSGEGGGSEWLEPDGKVFGQTASADLTKADDIPPGGSAGLVLLNSTAGGTAVDGYFIGLDRSPGEQKPTIRIIRLRGCPAGGLASPDGVMAVKLSEQPWDGHRLSLAVEKVGEIYGFLVDGKRVARDRFTLLEKPFVLGPVPAHVWLWVSGGIHGRQVHLDNLAIDHSVHAPNPLD